MLSTLSELVFLSLRKLMMLDSRKTFFVDVLLPLPISGTFTYRVPYEQNNDVRVGQRTIVQFGRSKIMSGIIMRIHEEVPQTTSVKYILGILDEQPIVNEIQFQFWNWIKDYYMCHLGEVMQAALPSALKLSSETMIVLSEDYVLDSQAITDNEYLIVEALQIQSKLTISEVSKIVGFKKVMPLIKTMIEKKIILMEEELNEKYKDKTERFISLSSEYHDDEKLHVLMDKLSVKAFKQLEVLLGFFALSDNKPFEAEVAATELLKKSKSTQTALKALIDKGVFLTYNKKVSRLASYKTETNVSEIKLTQAQQTAFDSVKQQFVEKDAVLLHGVTSSGKTEIYIKLIQEAIDREEQVLYLLPEIALTAQIINRLKKYFGNKVGVYHSRYNIYEKAEIWQQVLMFKQNNFTNYQIIIGSRSSIFLPFSNLGLIVVDEEHDSSFKQYDPAPRYQARDCALVLGVLHKAKVLLGSATPSYESYFNALVKKFGLTQLSERYGGVQMPQIEIVNLKSETRRKTMQMQFSSVLLEQIKSTLEEQNQVILFQNRRGFSLRLECDQCHWIPQCKNCDVSLIYHKSQNVLRCHYCGYTTKIPSECPECHSTAVRMHGFGTEKIEEDLKLIIPESNIARLDLDTTRSKNSYQQIMESFEDRKTNILVGTQMVTKGLDFDFVKLVGILNADNLLSFPDFRAFERSFQLMAQVSGRAGRKGKQGKVLIQTFQPDHEVLKNVLQNGYHNLFEKQMVVRKQYSYPPFYRLVLIQLKHKNFEKLNLASSELANMLRTVFKQNLLGPEYPMVSRIKNLYIKQILIKFNREYNPQKVKEIISEKIDAFVQNTDFKSVIIQIDVDPQ